MKYGVLEHCGTKENEYPIVFSNDKDLQDWIDKLTGQGRLHRRAGRVDRLGRPASPRRCSPSSTTC